MKKMSVFIINQPGTKIRGTTLVDALLAPTWNLNAVNVSNYCSSPASSAASTIGSPHRQLSLVSSLLTILAPRILICYIYKYILIIAMNVTCVNCAVTFAAVPAIF